MGRIPEATIQAIRDRVDLVDLIGRHVSLRRKGSRRHWGLCPFHDEKTPSFQVNPERGFYHCFGCGESGNAFEFLIRIENLSFPEAARSLASAYGIEIPEAEGGEVGLAERLLAANEVAQRAYRSALAESTGAAARAYLAGRGLSPETIERFGLGLAPDRWDGVKDALARERIPAEVGERAGLLRARERGGHYDLLRNRITFPIRDARGRIVAFAGRALASDQEPKYLNSPETPLFRKREAFYGLPDALAPIRRRDRAVVVEGQFDLIALHRAGLEETVATCGTALGKEHARALRRRAREVVLLFDGDEAGARAVLRALEVLLPEGLRVRAASLPEGADPDEFLAREGVDALRGIVDAAPPAIELAIRRAVALGCATPWEKSDAVNAVVPLLAAIPEAVERREFALQLALAAGVDVQDVLASLRASVRGESPPEAVAAFRPRSESVEERRLGELVRILLGHPGHAAGLAVEALLESASGPVWRELLPALFDACRCAPEADPVLRLESCLGAEALALLRALAVQPAEPFAEPEHARRILDDLCAWFERRREGARQRATTQRLRDAAGDRAALLQEKNLELVRRRAALHDGRPG